MALKKHQSESDANQLRTLHCAISECSGYKLNVFLSLQLSANLRHIRVFEMDVEDEDDEGAESQNTTADQDVLDSTMSSTGQGIEERAETEDEAGGQREDVLQNTEERLESEEALELT